MQQLVSSIRAAVLSHRWEWNVDGTRRVPTRDDIARMLRNMQEVLDNAGEGGYAEQEGILVRRHEGSTKVYIMIGELDA